MKHYFIFLSNNCICDYWANCKDEVFKHFRRGTVIKILEIY